MVEENIQMIPWFETHFGKCNEMKWETERKETYGTYKNPHVWSSSIFEYRMIVFLTQHKDNIVIEMLEWKLVKSLSPTILIDLYFKFQLYEKLDTIKDSSSFAHIPIAITKYPPPTGTFTLKQLSALKTFKQYAMTTDKLSTNKTMIVSSFKPFKARVYERVGNVHGKSKKFNSIFITPIMNIKKGDILFISQKEYPVETIFWNTQNIEEAYPGEDYSIPLKGCTELPENSTCVFKVEYF